MHYHITYTDYEWLDENTGQSYYHNNSMICTHHEHVPLDERTILIIGCFNRKWIAEDAYINQAGRLTSNIVEMASYLARTYRTRFEAIAAVMDQYVPAEPHTDFAPMSSDLDDIPF